MKKSRLNESTLINRTHKDSFGGLETDTLTFCESTPYVPGYPFPRFTKRGRMQCGGSGMFIPDPEFYPSRIPDPGSRIPDPKTATKERGEKKLLS